MRRGVAGQHVRTQQERARENETAHGRTRRPTGERGCPRENETAHRRTRRSAGGAIRRYGPVDAADHGDGDSKRHAGRTHMRAPQQEERLLSEWLVSDDLGGEPAGCGGPGLVWLLVVCGCEAGWISRKCAKAWLLPTPGKSAVIRVETKLMCGPELRVKCPMLGLSLPRKAVRCDWGGAELIYRFELRQTSPCPRLCVEHRGPCTPRARLPLSGSFHPSFSLTGGDELWVYTGHGAPHTGEDRGSFDAARSGRSAQLLSSHNALLSGEVRDQASGTLRGAPGRTLALFLPGSQHSFPV
ncbi:hypothetical protein WMY93_015743 [Mugilogobius chulae]|uniref:Uncharacterized protein n=1 Tax=Mugilogobius chulae TaxID=88201 RepID=A0AAW0P1Y5_9GOBI